MRTEIDQGGPAFPRIEPEIGGCGPNVYFGMTLRDYFAAKAIQGQLTAQDESGFGIWTDFAKLASEAYQIADAMLKARQA